MDWTSPSTREAAARAIDKSLMIYQKTIHAYTVERGEEPIFRALPSKWDDDDYKSKWSFQTMDQLLIMWNHLKEDMIDNKRYDFGASLIDPFGDGKGRTIKNLCDDIVDIMIKADEDVHDTYCEVYGEYPNALDFKRPSSRFLQYLSNGQATIRDCLVSGGLIEAPASLIEEDLQNKGEQSCLPA